MPFHSLFRPLTAFLSLFLLSRFILAGAAAAAETGPTWPLDLPERHLTSNFMEYRGGRYHAGLDFKTRSQEGFVVRAVEDGWISRLRVSPSAYGRALYVRGVSGRTFVYAHLARFNDVLRARVDAARAAGAAYAVRLSFGAGEIPVRRGDVLALSGQSGTGGPHLHFEVRDAANRPQDPQAEGFAVSDALSPRCVAVRAVPASPDARVCGGDTARVLTASGGADLMGELPELVISGPVAFSASLVEKSDAAGHRLEPYAITVTLDGREVYACRNESFDFAENGQQRLEWLDLPGVRERWLHRRDGVDVAGRSGGAWYLGPEGAGLAPGAHRLEIRAADRAGNATTVIVPLRVEPPGAAEAPAAACSAWRASPVAQALASSDGSRIMELTPFFEKMPEDLEGWRVRRLSVAEGDPVLADVVLAAADRSLSEAQRRQATVQGLAAAGGCAEFAAADWPVAAAPQVSVTADPALRAIAEAWEVEAPRWGLYAWERDSWRPAGGVAAPPADGTWTATLDRPGLVAVLRDDAPPVFSPPRSPILVAPAAPLDVPGITGPRWEPLAVGLADPGAGVDHATVTARLDGAPLIVEPDAPRDRVLVELPDGTPPGRHVLELRAADRAGLEASVTLEFVCGL